MILPLNHFILKWIFSSIICLIYCCCGFSGQVKVKDYTVEMEGSAFTPALEGMKHVKSEQGDLLTKPFLDVCKLILPILGLSSFWTKFIRFCYKFKHFLILFFNFMFFLILNAPLVHSSF